MPIVTTPDQLALQASLRDWAKQAGPLAAATERVAIGGGQDEAVEALLAAGGADSIYSERTGLHVAAAMSIALLGERGVHPATRKLTGVGHRQAVAETVLELLGPAGAAQSEASGEFLLTRCLSIAGGTTQILLNQVGGARPRLAPMMDFTPAESQRAVAALAAEILTEPDPWKELARAGLLDASSLGLLDTTFLLTEIGRRAPSRKAHATLMTGALPLARWGRRPDLVAAVASGELLLTAALREPSGPPATTVTDGMISGVKVGVPYAEQAHRILVSASSGVAVVDPADVTLTRTPSSNGEPEYTVRMDAVPIEGMVRGADCVQDLDQLSVAGACALADGAVAGALALTRDHVATREQFGRRLAAFQAVSQQIADVYIASRTLHLATLAACWRLDTGPEVSADLDVAGYWCAEQAPRAVQICHHLHGGLGMDVTYPLHRFSSLVADLVRYLGGAEYRLERLACSST